MEMAELFKLSQVQSMFAQLGANIGNGYVPSDSCYSK